MGKVIYHMATIPQREAALQEVLQTIINQADEIHIYLNEWDHIPDFLKHEKILVYKSQDEWGDLGDVGKFYNCQNWTPGYHFTVDDKILYPPNHTEKLIKAIELYNREVVVSFHGRLVKPNCKSYYHDYDAFYGMMMPQSKDKFVHELGTGAMAFHTDTVEEFSLNIFPHINMTDIYFSIFLQKLSIPILILAHKAGDYQLSQKHDDSYSIHNHLNKCDEFQTAVVNAFNWQLNAQELKSLKN